MVFFLKRQFCGDSIEEKKEKKPFDWKFAPEHYETFDGKSEHRYKFKRHMIADLGAAQFGFLLDRSWKMRLMLKQINDWHCT